MTATAPATLTRRLLRHYDATSDETRTLGRAWYDDARRFCAYLGAEYEYPAETVAAVRRAETPAAMQAIVWIAVRGSAV